MRYFLFIIACIVIHSLFAQNTTPYLNNETYTYPQLIQAYSDLDQTSPYLKLTESGLSDIGKPIHLVIIDKHLEFNPEKTRARKKTILFINNGIHAGEPCGIDASVELAKKIIDPKNALHQALDSVVLIIIPVYNVGGMLNRSSTSRANQNGPKEYGFRGNARNLDLNRDFIKVDSKNARTFTEIFRKWDPDVFIDTHTTNGSDHQYTLTLIATQKDKQNPILSDYAQNKMIPTFYTKMAEKKMDIIPYVYNYKTSPEEGIIDFMETARYSSGYAALFDCFSFITEAHVFKPFKSRVEHSLQFLEIVTENLSKTTSELLEIRAKAKTYTKNKQRLFTVQWTLDTTTFRKIKFKGYETKEKLSNVTDLQLMTYDDRKPYSKSIKYYNTYTPTVEIRKPKFYLIPQAYSEVIDRLQWNKIEYSTLAKDTLIEVRVYTIEAYDSPKEPYEGHFLHFNIRVSEKVEKIPFYSGDYLIQTNQVGNRYILETLEPLSVDGFFAWNFFDGILQQKEWFSDFAFEPKAKEILDENEELRKKFEEKKVMDPDFATNSWAQLYFIYQQSEYFEPTVNRFPIYRID